MKRTSRSKTAGQEFTICEYNLENLFVSMEYYDGQDLTSVSEETWKLFAVPQFRHRQKPLTKLWGLAGAILDINPDILMLAEVGGVDSLNNFNRYFLREQYLTYFVEGNSNRGIGLGFLVRSSFPLKAEVQSHRETPVEVRSLQGRFTTQFSRDVAEMRLYKKAASQDIQFVLLLVHLKSRLSTHGDVQGKDRRTAEAIALAELYQELRLRFPGVPVVLGGDFNADLGSLELELLNRSDLVDFREAVQTPLDRRHTLIFLDLDGGVHRLILDYLLISPELQTRVVKDRSYVYRYKSFYGIEDMEPNTETARRRMPSDHYPVVLTLKL